MKKKGKRYNEKKKRRRVCKGKQRKREKVKEMKEGIPTSEDVVLVVLVGGGAHFDETGEAIVLDEGVDEVFVILEYLLQGE